MKSSTTSRLTVPGIGAGFDVFRGSPLPRASRGLGLACGLVVRLREVTVLDGDVQGLTDHPLKRSGVPGPGPNLQLDIA